jgi:hypothetical protein
VWEERAGEGCAGVGETLWRNEGGVNSDKKSKNRREVLRDIGKRE